MCFAQTQGMAKTFRVHPILSLLFALTLIFSLGPAAHGAGKKAPETTDAADFSIQHSQQLSELNYLLKVERLHFYIQSLADHLDKKIAPEVIKSLRSITPELIYQLQLSAEILDDSQKWTEVISNLVPGANKNELEWGYQFF